MNRLALAAALIASTVLAAGSANAAGDPVRGKKLFIQCGYCHGTAGLGGAIGPTLKGIVGKKSAQTPGFAYSASMKASGITWSEAELNAFLTAPQAKVKGTRMVFVGFKKPQDTEDMIAYLKTIK